MKVLFIDQKSFGNEDVKEALAAGMSAHVAKPIDMDLLKRTLNELIFTEKEERETQ